MYGLRVTSRQGVPVEVQWQWEGSGRKVPAGKGQLTDEIACALNPLIFPPPAAAEPVPWCSNSTKTRGPPPPLDCWVLSSCYLISTRQSLESCLESSYSFSSSASPSASFYSSASSSCLITPQATAERTP